MKAILVAVLVVSSGAAAHADDDKQLAAQHFDAATKAYLAGGDAEALGKRERAAEQYRIAVDEYKQSYNVARQPSTLYWLGEAYRALGELELALAAYRQYLYAAPPKGKLRQDAGIHIRRLEEAIEQKRAAQQGPPHGVPNTTEDSPPVSPETEKRKDPESHIAEPNAPPPILPVATRTAAKEAVPAYRRWWLWTTVSVGAVAIAVGLGVGLAPHSVSYPSAPSSAAATIRW